MTGEQLFRHLSAAAAAYHQALELFPAEAADDLAVTYRALGNIYADVDDSDSALGHYQKAIQYSERIDDRYGAGRTRLNAAMALTNTGRRYDALLYAQAALRDLETAGPAAASDADEARQLIAHLEFAAYLEQEPPDETDANPS